MYKINYKHLYFKYKKKFIHQGGANNNEDENYFSQINFKNVHTFLKTIDRNVIFFTEKSSSESINKNTSYWLSNINDKIIFVWKNSSDNVKIQYSFDINSLIDMHYHFYTDRDKKDIKQNFFVLELEKNSNNFYKLINAQRYINMIKQGISNLKKKEWLKFKDNLKKERNIDKVEFYNIEKKEVEKEDILEKEYDDHVKVSKYQLNNLIIRYNDTNNTIKVHMDDMII